MTVEIGADSFWNSENSGDTMPFPPCVLSKLTLSIVQRCSVGEIGNGERMIFDYHSELPPVRRRNSV